MSCSRTGTHMSIIGLGSAGAARREATKTQRTKKQKARTQRGVPQKTINITQPSSRVVDKWLQAKNADRTLENSQLLRYRLARRGRYGATDGRYNPAQAASLARKPAPPVIRSDRPLVTTHTRPHTTHTTIHRGVALSLVNRTHLKSSRYTSASILPARLAIDCAHSLAAASLCTRSARTPGQCRPHPDPEKHSAPDLVTYNARLFSTARPKNMKKPLESY